MSHQAPAKPPRYPDPKYPDMLREMIRTAALGGCASSLDAHSIKTLDVMLGYYDLHVHKTARVPSVLEKHGLLKNKK